MSVFLSHRTADNQLAREIHDYLTRRHGITCYLDDLDKEAAAAGEREITNIIVRRLKDCTNLMAIMTPNTKGSWWVPFEIGVAREAPRFITSYTNIWHSMPEYLKEWPVLQDAADLDKFAAIYKAMSVQKKQAFMEKRAYASASPQSMADNFHSSLKASLRQ